jgi:hypothetical protein
MNTSKTLNQAAAGLFLAGLVWFAGATLATAQVLVYSATYSSVDDGPFNVVAADVNGDGKLDLICANDGISSDSVAGNSLTVLTNNGDGTFTFSADMNVGYNPYVTAADVNHDGKMDLISANYNDDTLIVLTNNGTGVFGSNATYNVGSGPIVALAANVNGDGRQYLFSLNNGNNTLTVLTNDGSGHFVSNATYNVGNGPVSLITADVNGNGKLALVCANSSDNSLLVLTNNGSGVFGSNATYTVGNGPNNVVAADVNGDGWVDLISANDGPGGTGNTLTVLTNNGSGKFIFSATVTVGQNPYVAAADMNGDNKVDLIAASTSYNNVLVLTNNGTGVFGSNALYSCGQQPFCVIAADLSGNGKQDLITANNNDTSLTVLSSSGPPPPLTAQSMNVTNVLLSWPANWFGYGIQQNSVLVSTNWTSVTNAINNATGTNKAIVPILRGNKFFRLVHP